VALRAQLAALMVLALLVTGVFNARPTLSEATRPAGQTQRMAGTGSPAIGHRPVLTRSRSGAQVGQASRLRHVGRRSPRFEEIHQAAQAIAWPDLEKGAPSAPRFLFRKIPSDEGADADADQPHAPVKGYRSRAPPALA
jgi:hypothetical protein